VCDFDRTDWRNIVLAVVIVTTVCGDVAAAVNGAYAEAWQRWKHQLFVLEIHQQLLMLAMHHQLLVVAIHHRQPVALLLQVRLSLPIVFDSSKISFVAAI